MSATTRHVTVLLVSFLVGTFGGRIQPNLDEVKSLPGLNFNINFRHYSGYLDGENDTHLHYWLFESQRCPETDPVVFWFNGGPGASSLYGALSEQGPFRINSNLTLTFNQYAWNAEANILFLESPAAVGYSYKDDNNYTIDDDLTARNNFAAIKSFFKKYPQWENNDFYITGESYSGIYVPLLTVLAVDNHYPKKLKGFAIGNGLLDEELGENSRLHYLYHHALINDDHWFQLLDSCCPNIKKPRDCRFIASKNSKCQRLINEAETILSNFYYSYNIYDGCINFPAEASIVDRWEYRGKFCTLPNDDSMVRWLNQKSVRQALNIKPDLDHWDGPDSHRINYRKQYTTMRPQIKHLVDSGLKALIYNGDFDSVCNYLGDRWFVENLGYKADTKYQPWEHDGKIAGFEIKYGNLTFATVMASGHMVPYDQPGPAQTLFHRFLKS